jgi:hypothetical protein
MIAAQGQGGEIQFDGQYVTIIRKGGVHGKGEKRLQISQIAAIQWKPAGLMVSGFIQLTVPGGIERRSLWGNRTLDALVDENSVAFPKKQQPYFEKLRAALDEGIAAQHAVQPPDAAAPKSVADELEKLAQLRERGILTDAEFQEQKARLLSR